MSYPLYTSVLDTVGGTPLVKLNNITKDLPAEIYLKCEFRNPLFSVKDRIAKAMVETAEAEGKLSPGGLIIEPTSGNTGIGLAFVSRVKGYRCLLVMPETMSIERRTLLRMLGAEIILTPGALGMKGAINKAEQLIADSKGQAFGPSQFSNPANPQAHYDTTGPEIWSATKGGLNIFVASVGTGGTFSGISRYLKERNPDIKTFAVEPAASPVISGGQPGAHKLQGIGAGFIPKNLDLSLIDEVLTVEDQESLDMALKLASEEGIPAGITTGANVLAAIKLARRPENAGKRIITIGASATERYLSTVLAAGIKEEVSHLPVSEV